MRLEPVLTSAILAFVLGVPALAQTSHSTLQGMVRDPTGAAVPGAAVTVANEKTGVTNKVRSNGVGWFVVPYLLAGDYSVEVEQSGFRRYSQRAIKLDVQQTLSLNVELAVGDLATTVQVESTPPPIITTDGTLAVTIDNKALTDLPLGGSRDIRALALLAPGVAPGVGSAGQGTDFSPFLGGGRNANSEVRVDGTAMSTPDQWPGALTTGGSMPNVDAVLEITVLTNTLAAEYGRTGGGAILVASKQGTNKLHGSAFEFFQNNNLNANDFFSNRAGAHLNKFTTNQYGFSVGGPVVIPGSYDGRNRTFFMADYQRTVSRSPSNFLGTVPPAAWKTGDFSNLRNASGTPLTIFDPLTAVPANNYIRQQFPENRIPLSRFDPVARKLLTYYPEPNTTAVSQYTNVNNFFDSQTTRGTTYNLTARIDQNFGSAWRSFWRVTKYLTESHPPNVFGNLGTPLGRGDQTVPKHSVTWDNTVTLSPTMVLNVSYGMSRFANTTLPPSAGIDLTSLGFPQSYQSQAARDLYTRFPRVDITGLTSLGQQNSAGIKYVPTSHNLIAQLTRVLSRHTLKTGFEYRKFFLNFWQESTPGGSFSYTVNWTQRDPVVGNVTQGFGLASMILGLGGGSQSNAISQALASSYYGAYVQDDFRVSPSLTLNFGVRYELDMPRTERYNRLSYFDLDAPSPIAGQVPGFPNLKGAMKFVTPDHRRQVPTDLNNVSPRFGFARRLGRKSVVRGGYGLMYAPSLMQVGYGNAGFQGFRCSTSMITSVDGRTPTNFLSNPFPDGFCQNLGAKEGPISGARTGLGGTIGESWFPASINPIIQQWNLNVHRALPGRLVLEVGYLGNKGNHIANGESLGYDQLSNEYLSLGPRLSDTVPNPFYGIITDPTSTLRLATVQRRQILRPYPQYLALNAVSRPTGNSLYHAGILRLERRFAAGFGFLLSYTKAKTIDDSGWGNTLTGQNGSSTRQDVYSQKLDRSISADDVAQRLSVSFNYNLPFGRGRHFLGRPPKAVQALAGGWQFNGIVTMQSGTPIPIFSAVNQIGLFNSGARPSNNGTSARISDGSKDDRMRKWFDPLVFTVAPSYTYGTAGRVLPDVREPGIRKFDLSMFKSFGLLRDNRLRAEFRLEAFNAFNTTQFGRSGSVVGDAQLGVISTVGVAPRSAQVALKVLF
jgi:hypothetical protein